MRFSAHLAGTVVLSVALFAVAAACGDSAKNEGASHGVVTAVDASARTITLDHEDIPGVMTAMTMTFEVAPDVELEGIEPGAEVDFQVKQAGAEYTVTELRRSAP
ncbi:MAG: copper-binding protein [Myxococcota bacterium]